MKLFLCSMPFSAYSPGSSPKYENLGLCYLSAFLKNSGFEVAMYDGNIPGTSFESHIENINLDSFGIIGFSVYSTNYENTINAINKIRQRGFKGHITMGGHFPSFNMEAILKNHREIDSIVFGEGEITLRNIAENLKQKAGIENISGLSFNNCGVIVRNPPEHLMESLDFSFHPDRSHYETVLKTQNFSTISSSRGCWGSCSFCSVRNFYNLSSGECWRFRSPENVVDEIEEINKRLDITSFAFFDDNFIGPGKKGKLRARKIAEEIRKRKIDIAFSIECRPDDIDEETLSLLKVAGLVKLSIGAESFLERQLRLYGKDIHAKKIHAAIKVLERLELLYSIYLILFDPYVTFDELMNNFQHIYSIGPLHFPRFSGFLQVFRGIPLYEKLKNESLLCDQLIGKTERNEYWIGYSFKDKRIGIILDFWLRFEEKAAAILSRSIIEIGDEKAFEAYKNLRKLTFMCFKESLAVGNEISKENELKERLHDLFLSNVIAVDDLIRTIKQSGPSRMS